MTGPMSTMCDESTPHSAIWDSPGRCLTRPTQIHWQENMRREDIRGLGSIVWTCRMHKYSRPGGITSHGSLIWKVSLSEWRASVEYNVDGKPSKAIMRACNVESGVTW